MDSDLGHDTHAAMLVTTTELVTRLYHWWPSQDRDDLVQEVAFKYLAAFPPGSTPDNPEAWLTRVIRNAAINLHRAEERRPQRAADADGADPIEVLFTLTRLGQATSLQAIQNDLVESFLSLVPERDRELIRMKHLNRMSSAEIGVELGMQPNAVDQATSRAVRRLREAATAQPDLIAQLRDPHPRIY